MLGALAALLIASTDAERVTAVPERTVAIDAHPLMTVGAAAGVAARGGTFVNLPFSATIGLNEHTALSVEVAASFLQLANWTRPGWTFSASLGPTFFFFGDALSGLFFTPKLIFFAGRPAFEPIELGDVNDGPIQLGPGVGRAFMGGLDAGWQWRWKHLHVALVAGFSLGYGWDTADLVTSYWTTTFALPKRQGFVWGLNLDLLRVGVAF